MKKIFNISALCFVAMVFCACPDPDPTPDPDPDPVRTNDLSKPSVTGNVTNLTSLNVTLQGWANILIAYDTEIGIKLNWSEYGENSSTYTSQSLDSDNSYSINIYNLSPGTTYNYCSYVRQGNIYHYGEIASFTTPKADFNVSCKVLYSDVYNVVVEGDYNLGNAKIPDGYKYYAEVEGVSGECLTDLDHHVSIHCNPLTVGQKYNVRFCLEINGRTYKSDPVEFVPQESGFGIKLTHCIEWPFFITDMDLDTVSWKSYAMQQLGLKDWYLLELGADFKYPYSDEQSQKVDITNELADSTLGSSASAFTSVDGVWAYNKLSDLIEKYKNGLCTTAEKKTFETNADLCEEYYASGFKVRYWLLFNRNGDRGVKIYLSDYVYDNDFRNGEPFPWNVPDGDVNNYKSADSCVNLGLSVNWATFNIGATASEEHGNYYAWGETNSKTDYDWDTYKWCNGTEKSLNKYCTSNSYGTVDNKTTLDISDDAASVNWGGSWRMPTSDEWEELTKKCKWEWTTLNGVYGYKVTSKKNSKSIFLPATGYYHDKIYYVNTSGKYWSNSLDNRSSSLFSSYTSFAQKLSFDSKSHSITSSSRYEGHCVRAVCPNNDYDGGKDDDNKRNPFAETKMMLELK